MKSAATSKTTKTAVKNAAGSKLVKTAVSAIVLDAALPQIKERVAERLKKREDTQDEQESDGSTADNLGEWDEPTMLGLDSDLYRRYLQHQITVLSEYETYLEQFESADYDDHLDRFYNQCENPELQLRALQLVANSIIAYKKYIENYAVRNDEFREHVLTGPSEPDLEQAVLSDNDDTKESLEDVERYIDHCNEYLDHLCKYTDEDQKFATYVSSYGNRITGDVDDLEIAVLAVLQYLSYIEEYTEQDSDFRDYVEDFSPEGEAYYSLLEAENQILKNI